MTSLDDYPEDFDPERWTPSDKPKPPQKVIDLSDKSVDEILQLHREIHPYEPGVDILERTYVQNPDEMPFSCGFELLCMDDPATACEFLVKLSLSDDEEEVGDSVTHLPELAHGNVAAAMAMFEDVLSGRDHLVASYANERVGIAQDEGTLSFQQAAYLLGIYAANPFVALDRPE